VDPFPPPHDGTAAADPSAGGRGPGLAALSAVAVAVVASLLTIVGWLASDWAVTFDWIPSLGLRFEYAFDGLAALYAVLATGIGLLVFIYATGYMPRHLDNEGRPRSDDRRFWAWMVAFMLAMVGLAGAQDLVSMFVFFDLTALASYFLIGFDRHRADARGAAFMALTVTAGSAVAMLVGAVLLDAEYGTFSIPAIIDAARPTTTTTVACALIVIAALAKSAQVPFHFWLPRAMAAPTPVSAYLHSAAMVAAGVLVLGRIHPLLALDQRLLDALVVVGFASIAVGGILALAQDELKQILAHSTISQYGYVVVLYGIGGETGAAGAALYVIAHALAKSALFMAAGVVTEATGESRLSELGGLGRRMPVLATATAVAAASLAALPFTLGFFKDELFFTAATGSGPVIAVAEVLSAALTVAYIGRFWFGLFDGPLRIAPHAGPPAMVIPIVTLAVVSVIGGVVVEPFARLATDAASVIGATPVEVAPAYHLDARTANLMAVVAWVTGVVVLLATGVRERIARAVARVGDRYGPRHLYGVALDGIDRLSDAIHRAEVRDLRNSLAAILVPTGILAALGFAATPTDGSYALGPLALEDAPIVILLALAVAAAATAARDSGRLRPALALSVLGFALAGVYAIRGAPDVALVAVVIETVLSIVFVAVFARLPGTTLGAPARERGRGRSRFRNLAAGVLAGVAAFGVIWAALSRPPLGVPDAEAQIRLTPSAHGGDVVTVILADFRGLDTMVEITVLAVAIVGVAGLLRHRSSA
jgi:multicomponent Na+:H+ antiporter subunit A